MPNKMLPGALTLAFLMALAACSDPKPPQDPQAPPPSVSVTPAPVAAKPHLVSESIGTGGVELGMSEADVRARLGAPVGENKAGDKVVFMSYHASQIFGVYFDEATGRVRMIILSVNDKTWCTDFDVCLYRDGDLPKLIAHHEKDLVRFVDRDGSVTYRILVNVGEKQVLTEYTPNDAHQGVVQVAILYWNGKIDTSSVD
ncbi:MAG: hypothetical protein ABL973_06050 [Micropepsaceae bacterium]